jgi:hypothetical protein
MLLDKQYLSKSAIIAGGGGGEMKSREK